MLNVENQTLLPKSTTCLNPLFNVFKSATPKPNLVWMLLLCGISIEVGMNIDMSANIMGIHRSVRAPAICNKVAMTTPGSVELCKDILVVLTTSNACFLTFMLKHGCFSEFRVGVLVTRPLLFGVHIRAPDFWKLPCVEAVLHTLGVSVLVLLTPYTNYPMYKFWGSYFCHL